MNLKKLKTNNSQHIAFFELCYAEGEKEITLGGVPQYIKQAYRDYYKVRKNNEQEHD